MNHIRNIWLLHISFSRIIVTLLKAFYSNCIDRLFHKNEYNRLKQFKDIHKGKRLFIVATGPSLTLDDINLIKGEICFSMNSIYKLFDKTDWRPDYFAIYDQRVYKLLNEDLKKQNFNCAFCPAMNTDWEKPFVYKTPVNWDWKYLFKEYASIIKHDFSNDITKHVYPGTNVVYVIFQIAFYMGFSDIYILGADCTMATNNHCKAVEYGNNTDISSQTIVPNEHVIADYATIKDMATQRGINVYNATRGGALEIFKRVKLEDIINNH